MSNAVILAGEYRKIQSLTLATGQTPKPGQLLQITSDGELTVNASSANANDRMVATEDALQGKTVDDAYVAGTVCDCAVMLPGSESLGLLASGENVVIGDLLMSNASGKFAKRTSTNHVFAVALEAKDLSASDAVDTLIKVRWV